MFLLELLLQGKEKSLVIDFLEGQVNCLKQLPCVTAYSGSLNDLRASSYIKYSEVISLIRQKQRMLDKLKKDLK